MQQLAERIVDAIVRQGYVKPAKAPAAIAARVAALVLDNLEQEVVLEEEAERMAEAHRGKMVGMDHHKVVQMIKRKLAEERGFPL